MPRQPLAAGLALAVALVTVACSSGGDSPSPGDKSGDKTTSTTKPPDSKLDKLTGKDDIKNVILKTDTGKISLSAKAPGHEIMEQIYDSTAKTWSAPTSVYKDDARFCHSIKAKRVGGTFAASVRCSISAQDTNGTQSSYVLGSTDGKNWKRMDLSGGGEKPFFSVTGTFVGFPSPTGYLLWNPQGAFTMVQYPQSEDSPAVGLMQNNGVLLIIKATEGSKHTCTISFQTASGSAPTPRVLNSTAALPDLPKCMASSAHFQGSEIIANFTMTTVTKENGKKVEKTETFSHAFARSAEGHWVIKV